MGRVHTLLRRKLLKMYNLVLTNTMYDTEKKNTCHIVQRTAAMCFFGFSLKKGVSMI